jgi:hypothetical protein
MTSEESVKSKKPSPQVSLPVLPMLQLLPDTPSHSYFWKLGPQYLGTTQKWEQGHMIPCYGNIWHINFLDPTKLLVRKATS